MKHAFAAMLAGVAVGGIGAQDKAATGRFTCGGEELTAVAATLDTAGWCTFAGKTQADAVHTLRVEFPEFTFPAVGAGVAGKGGIALQLDGIARQGSIDVAAFGCDRVALRGALGGAGSDTLAFACDAVPTLAAVSIEGAQNPTRIAAVADRPNAEDIVFAALGNTGSGLPGQRRIGKTLGDLAPSGPLDFVLLLGDSFLPAGVADCNDAKWQTCFQQPYPEFTLPVPFHVVPGARDLRGNEKALLTYGQTNWRWQMPEFAGDFTLQAHGKEICCIGFDAARYFGAETEAATGSTRRMLISRAARSQALWKIVFGNVPLYAQSGDRADPARQQLREALRDCLENAGVDLYIAAGGHYLEVQQPGHGPLQVCSGGGGGREVAGSAKWGKDTMFAATGGGFFWFRFDGVKWEISARDGDGKLLFVHQLYPR
jgi:hypothetical protein